ncbi:MAG TPA: alpha/beta fold hydrolase [Kineosporiaceae bacterium]
MAAAAAIGLLVRVSDGIGERMKTGAGAGRTLGLTLLMSACVAVAACGGPVASRPGPGTTGAARAAGSGSAGGPTAGPADAGPGVSTSGVSSAVVLDGPSVPTPAHPFARYLLTGARSGVRAEVLVRLPAAYFDPAQATRRLPVIETFHGMPGHAPQWLGRLRLGELLDRQAAARRTAPAIIVSPDMNYPDQADSECMNSGRAALETWATQDVPEWVARTFRARTDRDGWATIGLSAGGWCAAMAVMLHPDRFRAAIVLSGYFRPQLSAGSPAVGEAALRRYDLVALARRSPPQVGVWLLTSPHDAASYPTSVAVSRAPGPLAVTAQVLPGQDHSWVAWARAEPVALDWLARTAPGFAP